MGKRVCIGYSAERRASMKKILKRYVCYPLEALAAVIVFSFFKILPLNIASATGGFIGRAIGAKLKVTNVARDNMRQSFPEKSADEIENIIIRMWDNIGRNLGEFPHVNSMEIGKNVELNGAEILDSLHGKQALFVTAHFGNWELTGLVAKYGNFPLHSFYRAPNNPLVHWIYKTRLDIKGELLPKGSVGARRAIQLLRKGENIGILADQKMNDGIPVEFFGRPAMTAPALAQFAIKFNSPIIMVRSERLEGTNFRLTVFPPLEFSDSDNASTIMRKVNSVYEDWIRKKPEQWFWVHKRWSKTL